MAHHLLRRGDTRGSISYQVWSGLPSSIASATALFNGRNAAGELVVAGGAATISEITPRPDGSFGAKLAYAITTAASLDPAGDYSGAFVVTFPDATVQAFPAAEGDLTYTLVEEPSLLDDAATPSETRGFLQTQTAHGFAVGAVLYWATTAWAKAIATADATMGQAIVVAVEGANSFRILLLTGTQWTWPSHAQGAAGAALYLSQSVAGTMTTARPTTGRIQQLAQVKDANNLFLQAFPVELA